MRQILPFRLRLQPGDTTVYRGTDIALLPVVSGDEPKWVTWEPSLFLECGSCLCNGSRPQYDITYRLNVATV